MRAFLDWLSHSKKQVLILLVVTFAYGLFKIVNYSFSYDTDLILLDPKNIMDSWLGLGRYFLVFLKWIFSTYDHLYLINFLTYVNIFIYSILFIYFLNINVKKTSVLRDVLCGALLITSPFFLEQYNFTLQSFEVSFSMILMMLSYIFTYYYLSKKKKIFAFITIILLISTFGVYQSFINLYVVGVLICLYKINDLSFKENLQNIFKTVFLFLMGMLGYFVVSNVVQDVLNIPTNPYLNNMIMWNRQSILTTLFGFLKDIVKLGLGIGEIFNLSFIFSYFLIFWLVVKGKRSRTQKVYIFFLMLAPFLLNFLTGSRVIFRSFLSLPIVCSFFFFETYHWFDWIKFILILCLVGQIVNGILLLVYDYKRYLNDVDIASKIYRDCGNSDDVEIVIKGLEYTEENIPVYRGEVMGSSYFEWTIDGENADLHRINNFMKIHGFNVKLPTDSHIDQLMYMNFEKEYPNPGYYVVDHEVCYVNLGD